MDGWPSPAHDDRRNASHQLKHYGRADPKLTSCWRMDVMILRPCGEPAGNTTALQENSMPPPSVGDLDTRLRFLRITPASADLLRTFWKVVEPMDTS